jgi:hypothetical protein
VAFVTQRMLAVSEKRNGLDLASRAISAGVLFILRCTVLAWDLAPGNYLGMAGAPS